jgi:hypothetical protein
VSDRQLLSLKFNIYRAPPYSGVLKETPLGSAPYCQVHKCQVRIKVDSSDICIKFYST